MSEWETTLKSRSTSVCNSIASIKPRLMHQFMKSALKWLNSIGEAAMGDAMLGRNPPGCETERLIKEIQIEALEWAKQEHLDSIRAEDFDNVISAKIKAIREY